MQLAHTDLTQKLEKFRGWSQALIVVRILILLWKTFKERKIPVLAQSLAYTTIFTLAPILAIFYFVLGKITQNTAIQHQIKEFISDYLLPQYIQGIFTTLENLSTDSYVFGVIGFPTLFLTGVFLYVKIDSSINEIWMSNKETQWFKTSLAFFMTLFFGPMILVLVFSIPPYLQNLPFIREVIQETGLSALITQLIPFLVVFVGLSVLYIYIPTVSVHYGAAIRGAFAAAVFIQVSNFFLAIYIKSFSRLDVFYGSLATILILLLYVYIIWAVVLTGAVLTFILQYHKESGYVKSRGLYNDESILSSALTVMAYLTQCFEKRNEAPDFDKIQLMLGINRKRLSYILEVLVQERLVTVFQELKGKRNLTNLNRYQPGQSTESIYLKDLAQIFYRPREHAIFPDTINQILNTLEVHPGFVNKNISLQDLFKKPKSVFNQIIQDIDQLDLPDTTTVN